MYNFIENVWVQSSQKLGPCQEYSGQIDSSPTNSALLLWLFFKKSNYAKVNVFTKMKGSEKHIFLYFWGISIPAEKKILAYYFLSSALSKMYTSLPSSLSYSGQTWRLLSFKKKKQPSFSLCVPPKISLHYCTVFHLHVLGSLWVSLLHLTHTCRKWNFLWWMLIMF